MISILLLSALLGAFAPQSHAEGLDCSRAAGSLPDPAWPAGTLDPSIPIQHVIVIMQENHSFDEYLGRLNDPRYYGSQIDGVTPELANPDRGGEPVHAFHETHLCVTDTDHTWNGEHRSWDEGRNDGFVRTNGKRTMGYYEYTELPFYYSLASEFATADRYFCSAITQTFPNRFFLYAGTAFGQVRNEDPPSGGWTQKTLFDVLDQYSISWKYYTDSAGYLGLFGLNRRDSSKMAHITDYQADLASGRLPQVAFLDAEADTEDEHPDANVQIGQAWVARRIEELMGSSAWPSSALFLTFDENGGFYDHVAPPEACDPDGIAPKLNGSDLPGDYKRYGFRVPFIAISPYAKHHYVSHATYDHTSILKFIEAKFNLPALTRRDANANGLEDVFDFGHPRMETPALAPAPEASASASCVPDNS